MIRALVDTNIILDFLLHILHPFLETLDALSEALHEFGNLPAAEEQQHYEGDDENFPNAEVLEQQ